MPAALAYCAPAVAKQGRLGLRVVEQGAKVGVTLTPHEEPIQLAIRLNGKRIEDRFDYTPPTGRRVIVGLDEGLRCGRNVLEARALYPDGKRVRRVRRFELGRGRPLVGAGEGGTAYASAELKLRGTARLCRRHGQNAAGRVRYRWHVVEAPRGFHAGLENANSRRARLRPDRAGTYRVAVTARALQRVEKGGRGTGAARARSDVTEFRVQAAEMTRAGIFIGTDPFGSDGDPTAIHIYGGENAGTYAIGDAAGSAGPIATLIFDRCTLDLLQKIWTQPVEAAEVIAAIEQQQQRNGGCNLLVVTAGADYGDAGLASMFLNLSVGQQFLSPNTDEPFWAVWIPDPADPLAQGNGWTNSPEFDGSSQAGRLAGVLVPDGSSSSGSTFGSYTFRPSTIPAYGPGNAQLNFAMDDTGITVPPPQRELDTPPVEYPAGAPNCSGGDPQTGFGGFQLLALGASGDGALTEVPIAKVPGPDGSLLGNGDTFWLNGCTAGDSLMYAEALADVLASVGTGPADPPTLVFLQGVGLAFPPADQQNDAFAGVIEEIALQLGELGGSPEAFAQNPAASAGAGYSFVGQTWPRDGDARVLTEVTGSAPNSPPAQLAGYLSLDRQWRLEPGIGTPAGDLLGADQQAMQALNTVSAYIDPADGYQPGPFPGAADPQWQAAMHYAAAQLRLEYEGNDLCYVPPILGTKYGDIRSLYCDGGEGAACTNTWTTTYGPKLTAIGFAAGHNFDEATWAAVQSQLAGPDGEFAMVDNVNCQANTLQSVFEGQAIFAFSNVSGIVNSLNDRLGNQETSLAGEGLEIVSSILNLVTAISGLGGATDTFVNASWALSGSFDLASQVATDSSGAPILGPLPPDINASTLALQLTEQWQDAAASLALPRDQIASDWIRLRRFSASGMDISTSMADNQTTLTLGAYYEVWRMLIRSYFPPAHLGVTGNPYADNPPPVNVPEYVCSAGDNFIYAFRGFDPADYTYLLESPTSSNRTGLEAYALAHTYNNDAGEFSAQPPPPGILDQIFAVPPTPSSGAPPPPVQDDGTVTPLGISKQLFFSDLLRTAQASDDVLELGMPLFGDCPNP